MQSVITVGPLPRGSCIENESHRAPVPPGIHAIEAEVEVLAVCWVWVSRMSMPGFRVVGAGELKELRRGATGSVHLIRKGTLTLKYKKGQMNVFVIPPIFN